MRLHVLPLLLAGLSVAMAQPAARAAADRSARVDFDSQPALERTLEPDEIDHALLAAAIFHETNRVRTLLGLKPFRGDERLGRAAETQAEIGSLFRPPSHTNPFPFIATPVDRVRQAGLNPRRVAENIALIPVYNIPDGVGVYQLKGDSRFRDVRTDRLIEPHSCRSYAVAVVEAWMNSPGHRENIVNPGLQFLGCAVRATKSLTGIDMIFAVQVFATPRGRGRPGR